ncbi:serine/threonine-protein kinase [Thalassotalea sediminis]|uniref:serine/threonine-protein kinase n=1 Tax=Thalassotalea sediminis TaxID=1759089 RepID=UPI0025728F4F|nr:serine/threonine-protein kinase [Thalassotalea sediminis]
MLYEYFVKAISLSPSEQKLLLAEVSTEHPELYDELVEMIADDQRHQTSGTTIWSSLLANESENIFESAQDLIGRTMGSFTLIELLAQGGMGSVYKACRSDGQFEQTVAIKVLYQSLEKVIGEKALIREAGFMAKLAHPNIGKVFDAGLSEYGDRYIIMEFVDGCTIDKKFSQLTVSLNQKLSLFSNICAAINHAHQMQVVHADLKPSNILIDKANEIKVLDFGISRMFNSREGDKNSIYTMYLNAMTTSYASPELLAGGRPSMLSDIYALGKVLENLIVKPLTSKSRYLAELNSIVVKATAERLTDRYASVIELQQDIERFINKKVVNAYNASPWYRFKKFVFVRHRIASVSAFLGSVFISVLLIRLFFQNESLLRANEQSDLMTQKLTQILALMDRKKSNGVDVNPERLLASTLEILQDDRLNPDSVAQLTLTLANSYNSKGYTVEARRLYKKIIKDVTQLSDPDIAYEAASNLIQMLTHLFDLDLIDEDTNQLVARLSFIDDDKIVPDTITQAFFYHRYMDGTKYTQATSDARVASGNKHTELLRGIINHFWDALSLKQQAEVTGFLARGLLTQFEFSNNTIYPFEQYPDNVINDHIAPVLRESVNLLEQSLLLHRENNGLDDIARGELVLVKLYNYLNQPDVADEHGRIAIEYSERVLGVNHPNLIMRYGELSKGYLYSNPQKSVSLAYKAVSQAEQYTDITGGHYLQAMNVLLNALEGAGEFSQYQEVAQRYFDYYLASSSQERTPFVVGLVANAMKGYYRTLTAAPPEVELLLNSIKNDIQRLSTTQTRKNVDYGAIINEGLIDDLDIIAKLTYIDTPAPVFIEKYQEYTNEKSALSTLRERIEVFWYKALFSQSLDVTSVWHFYKAVPWSGYEKSYSIYKFDLDLKVAMIMMNAERFDYAEKMLNEAKLILSNKVLSQDNAWQTKLGIVEAAFLANKRDKQQTRESLSLLKGALNTHFPGDSLYHQFVARFEK